MTVQAGVGGGVNYIGVPENLRGCMELCCILMVVMVKQIHVCFPRLEELYRIEGWIFFYIYKIP